MMHELFLYLVTAFVTHQIVSCTQTVLHFALGHRRTGTWICKSHLGNHHSIYSGNVMVSDRYLDEEASLDAYYVLPGAIIVTAGYLLLPFDIFVIHLSSLLLSVCLHLYLHGQYHLRRSWLCRFKWFQKKQRLHILHHKDMSKNFAVVGFGWDRVLGTYKEADCAMDALAAG